MRRDSAWILGALLCFANTGHAASVVMLSESQLIDSADLIVHGTVLSAETAYRAAAIPIFTDVTVEVQEVLKGTWTEPVIHVAMPGGELDGKRMSIPGTPSFLPGEEVCVFLRDMGNGERTTVGLNLGKYRIVTDAATGVSRAVRGGHSNLVPRLQANQTLRQAVTAAAPGQSEWWGFRRRIKDRVGRR